MNTHQLLKKADDCLTTARHEHAVSICNKILKRDPDCLHALFVMGKCVIVREKYASAAEYFKKILAIDPEQKQVLLEIGNALRLSGDHEAAIPFLREALLYQESDQHHLELGLALLEDDQVEEAKGCFLNALTFKPGSLLVIKNLGILAREQGDLDEARKWFQLLIDSDPGYPFAYNEMIKFHLMNRDPKAALAVCDDCLTVEPAYTRAFAMKHVALSELQDRTGVDYIFNPSRLIRRIKARPPARCGEIENFNKQLASHILNKAPMLRDSTTYATVNGWHSEFGELFNSNKKLGESMHRMIMSALDEYIENLPDDPHHPVNIGRLTETNLVTWAVVMDHQGHQKAHIHPKSWLSGVYYVQLPDDFDQQKDKHAGHIVFGRSHEELHRLHEPETVTLKPCEGDFVIFPGYFWHHTIPLQSHQKRICIAFDLERTIDWGE